MLDCVFGAFVVGVCCSPHMPSLLLFLQLPLLLLLACHCSSVSHAATTDKCSLQGWGAAGPSPSSWAPCPWCAAPATCPSPAACVHAPTSYSITGTDTMLHSQLFKGIWQDHAATCNESMVSTASMPGSPEARAIVEPAAAAGAEAGFMSS